MMVRLMNDLEVNAVALERTKEYSTSITQEVMYSTLSVHVYPGLKLYGVYEVRNSI